MSRNVNSSLQKKLIFKGERNGGLWNHHAASKPMSFKHFIHSIQIDLTKKCASSVMGTRKRKTNKISSTLEPAFRRHLEGGRQEARNIIMYGDKDYKNNKRSCCEIGWESG